MQPIASRSPPRWPRRLALATACFAVLGGLTTLLGWVVDAPRLTDWLNDGISTFPNTAACAVLSGLALLVAQPGSTRVPAVRVLAGIVAVIAGLTLVEHLTNVNLGIDRALFPFERPWGHAAASAPMRMGLPATISFVLIAVALLLLTSDGRSRGTATGLGVVVVAIASLSMIGFLYGAQQMFTIPRLTGIALPSAWMIAALAMGVIATAPEREPLRTFLEPGAAGMLARRTLPLIVGAALLLGWVRVLLQEHGLVDLAFGTALRTVVEVFLLTGLLWWAVSTIRRHEQARHRSESDARSQAEQLSAVLQTAAIGMLWIDRHGKILWANDAELKTLGYARDEYVGHHVAEFHADAAELLARVQRGEELAAFRTRVRAKDGSTRWMLVDSSVVRDDEGVVQARCFTRDVTDRMRAEEDRALLAAIIEASDDAIVSKTLDGIVTSWNAGAEHMFGYTAADMIGRPIETIIPHERMQEEHEILRRLRLGERIEHVDTVRRRKDGSAVDVSLTISPVKDSTGRIVGASKIARDISDRKRAEADREEADRRKDEFIAMLAHELRNPLAPIQSATRLLALLVPSEPRLVHAREVIERQVAHLTRLVDDLLDVSRITRGKVTLQREPLTLEAVVTAGVEVARPLIERLGHTLVVSHMRHGVRLEGDFARLVQVVSNLLTNAAKFTPANGRITVTTQETDGHATIRVRDTGVGIPLELQPRIFDLFVQADNSLARTNGGLGIGLTLVKRIVDLHGGTIEVRSDGVDRGAEFLVTLPALPPAMQIAGPPSEPRLPGGNVPVRVLIVEDNRDAAESLRMLLELGGHDVRVANDGLRALDVVDDFAPDIAFIDVGLPGIDGYEVASRVRAIPACRSSVLVALTGYGRDEDKQRATEAGFDHHLTKPVDFDAIDRLLANVSASGGEARSRLQ